MNGPAVPIAFDDAPPSSTGSIPFMSFNSNSASSFDDLNQAAAGSQYMNQLQGQMNSHQSGAMCFDNEPPLLEELGIDPKLILKRSMEVLNPTVSHPKLLADGDISGLLLYGAALGVFHLLAGKVQFGDILGFTVLVLSGIYWIVNCMAGEDEGNVELSRVSSMAGYSLLPIVAYAALCVVMPPRSFAGLILCAIAVIWSTQAATKALCVALPCLQENKGLVAIPCLLMYLMYALLTIY